MYCALCSKEFADSEKKIFASTPESFICGTCFERISYLKQYSKNDENPVADKSFEVLSSYCDSAKGEVSEKLREILDDYENSDSASEMETNNANNAFGKNSAADKTRGVMLMTSAEHLEGYRVTKQLGLVFGDTVFKAGFGSTVAAAFKDVINATRFSEREMSGQVGLIENARAFAIEKMQSKAKRLGANAIIAIDSESSVGGEIMKITIYGTAVYVEPEIN